MSSDSSLMPVNFGLTYLKISHTQSCLMISIYVVCITGTQYKCKNGAKLKKKTLKYGFYSMVTVVFQWTVYKSV